MVKRNVVPEIVWGENIEKAIKENETAVILFCAQWCGVCSVMRFDTLPKVMNAYVGPEPLKFFVAFSDLLHHHSNVKSIAEKYGVDEDHPTIIISGKNKKAVKSSKFWGVSSDQFEDVCEFIENALTKLSNMEKIAA